MIKVRFNDMSAFIDYVKYEKVTDHVCKLVGNIPQDTSGFHTFLQNGEYLGDRSNYTTIYKLENNGIMFSDDGSVYVEPEPTPTPEPIPDPRPSLEERVGDLEDAIIELYEALEDSEVEEVVEE